MRGVQRSLLLALAFLTGPSPAAAQSNAREDEGTRWASSSQSAPVPIGGVRETELQFGTSYERVSNGHSPWRSVNLEVRAAGPNGGALYAIVQETMRFSQLDHDVMVGMQHRVASRVVVGGEAEVSPSHRVLATWGALGRVELDAGGGWGVQASLRHTQYASASVDLGTMTLERYLGHYRAAYTFYVSRLGGAGASASHRAHGDLYYGRLSNRVGVSVSAGEELENVRPLGVVSTRVRAAAVVGRQWLTPDWFVVYDTLILEQGALYTRRRVSVSLGHQF